MIKKFIPIILLGLFIISGNPTIKQMIIMDYWSEKIDGTYKIQVSDQIDYCGARHTQHQSFQGCCYQGYEWKDKDYIEMWRGGWRFAHTLLHEIRHSQGYYAEEEANSYADYMLKLYNPKYGKRIIFRGRIFNL